MILNKLQRVWLSVVRLPPTAAFTEIEGYKVVAVQFQLFCVSLHAYSITGTLPPFVDFHMTCQHCESNHYQRKATKSQQHNYVTPKVIFRVWGWGVGGWGAFLLRYIPKTKHKYVSFIFF